MKKHLYSLKIVLALFCVLSLSGLNAQTPLVLYKGPLLTTPNAVNDRFDLIDKGSFKQVRFQCNQTGSSAWAFHIGSPISLDYSSNWRPNTSGNVMSMNTYIPTSFTNGARYNNNTGSDGGFNATNNYYYTWNVSKFYNTDEVMQVLETNFNPTNISTVSFTTPLNVSNSSKVTVTTSSSPSPGENIYIRYSADGFASSKIIPVAFTGTNGLAFIPCRGSAGNVSFYIYSSNKTISQINADVASYGQNAHDMSTLNLNNNGGANYSYTQGTGSNFSGDYIISPTNCYTTLASFVTAINAGTVSGPVNCYVDATLGAYAETAPAGGFSITATGSATKPILLSKIGANTVTFTASPALTSGSLTDAIFKIIGGDYITISDFTMLENNSNTVTSPNNMTEWGVALLNASDTNGPQNITLKNNTITLNRMYTNTFGIYSNAMHDATLSPLPAKLGGQHNNLTITGNLISNINQGIVVIGSSKDAASQNSGLVIGGSLGNGNQITNYGTAPQSNTYPKVSGTVNGILISNTKSFNISYNTIASSNAVTVTDVRGIYVFKFDNSPTGDLTQNISNNNISVISADKSSEIHGIMLEPAVCDASTLNIDSNDFNNFGHSLAVNVEGEGIISFITNRISTLNSSISNNTFTNINVNTKKSVTFIENGTSAPNGGTKTVSNNKIITGFTKSGAGGTVSIYTDNGKSVTGSIVVNDGNDFSNITLPATGSSIQGWSNTDSFDDSSMPTKTLTNNKFENWSTTTGADCVVMNLNGFGGVISSVSNNSIKNITKSSSFALTGINLQARGNTKTLNVNNNVIDGLTTTGKLYGINDINPALTSNITLNKIKNFTSAAAIVNAINHQTTNNIININNNIINNLTSTNTNSSAALRGISVDGAQAVDISGNTLYNFTGNSSSTSVTSPAIVGIISGSTGMAQKINNNTIYALKMNNASSNNNAVVAISTTSGSGGEITSNKIYGFESKSTGSNPFIAGYIPDGGIWTFANNMISLSNGVNTTGMRVCGVFDTGASGNRNYYYNSIYIGGSQTAIPVSAAFQFNAGTGKSNIRNNIFVMNRVSTGKVYAIANLGSSFTDFSSNYNFINSIVPGTAGVTSGPTDLTFAAWQTASGGDANSITDKTIKFVDINTSDLHLTDENCALDNKGIPVTTLTDFDGDTRNATTPDIGADEFAAYNLTVTPVALACNFTTGNLTTAITSGTPGVPASLTYWIDATANTTPVPNPTSITAGTYYIRYGSCLQSVVVSLQSATYSAGVWSLTPDINKALIFNSDYSATGINIAGCNCTVNSPANVTIAAGDTMTLQNELTVNNGGTFTIESDGNLIQKTDLPYTTNIGAISARREINIKDNNQYNYLISPLYNSNLKVNVYENQTTHALSSAPFTLYHNENDNKFYTSSGAYIQGRGLALKEPVGTVVSGPGKVNALFTGVPMTGSFTYTLANSETAATGYNLIGNPYPSNIDLDLFYNLNSNKNKISSTFYFWDNTVNSETVQWGSGYGGAAYAIFNAEAGSTGTGLGAGSLSGSITGSKVPTRVVKTGQGFMVRSMSITDKTVNFSNDIRISDAYPVFFGKAAQENTADDRYYLKLAAPTNIATQVAVVYFPTGNNGFAKDDSEMNGLPSDALYTIIDDKKVVINGRAPFINTDLIPLGLNGFTAGNYTFSLDTKEGIFANGQNIYLKDKQTGILTNLSEGNYTFQAGAGESTGRFEIVYKPEIVLVTDTKIKEGVVVYRDGTDFVIKSAKTLSRIEVYDLSGKLITVLKPNSRQSILDATRMGNGMYVLKITAIDGEVTNKKIVR